MKKKLIAGIASFALIASMVPSMAFAETREESICEEITTSLQANSNGSMGSAKEIPMNSSVTCVYSNADEQEWGHSYYWYKFKTSGRNSFYKIKVSSLDGSSADRFVYDSNGKYLIRGYYHTGISATEPVRTDIYGERDTVAKNSWTYIQLRCHKGSNTNGSRYVISITECPVLKSVTGLKASKKTGTSLSLKWSKQSNATKYQVKYKGSKGGWKTKTVTKNTVKLSKLKKKTQYQIKVRAYCKSGYNLTAKKQSNWGPWSKTIKVKTK